MERGGAVGAEVTGEAECGGGGGSCCGGFGEGSLRNLARRRDRGRVRRSIPWMVVKVLMREVVMLVGPGSLDGNNEVRGRESSYGEGERKRRKKKRRGKEQKKKNLIAHGADTCLF